MTRPQLIATLAAIAGAIAIARAQAPAPAYDIILRHGAILDGTGSPRRLADLAIANGSIARVGDLTGVRATIDLDVTGMFVAPGFINIHSHATAEGLPRAENMLTQGVTTEILNADGAGPIDLAAQLTGLAERGLAVNVGAYIGFNSVWSQVVGLADRRPNADDTTRMRTLITDGLSRGAWGVSAGLDYKPGYYAQTEEVIHVVDAAAPWRTNFTNHDRLTPESGFSSKAGMAETVAIGERAGLVPVITHMKVQGHEQGTADTTLSLMTQTTQHGRYTAADVYPYLAGQTGLAALIIPGWAQDGGRDAMLKRFADPALRARIVKESEAAMTARFGGAGGVYIPERKQELAEIATQLGVSPGEAVVRLLEQGNFGIIARFGLEADLVKIMKHPTSSIACDCGAVAGEAAHPRYFGTFPRVLGRYVREQKQLTWEDAIRKMAGLPATTIGMVDRGFLAAGMAADVVVFDPGTIIDHATFEAPTAPSEGVRVVIVNGRIALRDGKPTGEQAGRALKRTAHMPSRPMTTGGRRLLLGGTAVQQANVSIDLQQSPGVAAALGTFRLTDQRGDIAVDMKEFGLLQVAGDWASFTGRARLRASEPERSFTVIVDRKDPMANGAGTVVVDAGPDYQITGSIR